MSVGPPAAKGTISETGLLFGQFVCAVAALLAIKALALTMAANPANTVFFNFITVSSFLMPCDFAIFAAYRGISVYQQAPIDV